MHKVRLVFLAFIDGLTLQSYWPTAAKATILILLICHELGF